MTNGEVKLVTITQYDERYRSYLDQVELISREYLVDQSSTNEDEGVVEEPFDQALLKQLLSHKGAYLLLAVNEANDEVIEFCEFHTCCEDLPEQTEDLAEVMSDFKPFAWFFYIVKARRYGEMRGVTSQLCKATFDHIAADGCHYVVADYMLTPEFCNAGRRLLHKMGFVYAHRHYGLGLLPPERRPAGSEERVDTYEIMIKDIRNYKRSV